MLQPVSKLKKIATKLSKRSAYHGPVMRFWSIVSRFLVTSRKSTNSVKVWPENGSLNVLLSLLFAGILILIVDANEP